eukprot:scaffold4970_cov16-Prasinocladus_malaysianus.AAC.1
MIAPDALSYLPTHSAGPVTPNHFKKAEYAVVLGFTIRLGSEACVVSKRQLRHAYSQRWSVASSGHHAFHG